MVPEMNHNEPTVHTVWVIPAGNGYAWECPTCGKHNGRRYKSRLMVESMAVNHTCNPVVMYYAPTLTRIPTPERLT